MAASIWENILAPGQISKDKALASERRDLIRHWGEHPWNWLSGIDHTTRKGPDGETHAKGVPVIWTADERDENEPIKPYPADKDYLRELVNILHTRKDVFVDKSRQMMFTITVCLYIDWHCAFHANRLWLVSKIKEESAAKIINDKIRGPFGRLPGWVQQFRPIKMSPAVKIPYLASGSEVLAVAQNAAAGDARGNTASGVFVDEAAFQDRFGGIVSASMPMAEKFIAGTTAAVGTPGGRVFRIYADEGREMDEETGQYVMSQPPPPVDTSLDVAAMLDELESEAA